MQSVVEIFAVLYITDIWLCLKTKRDYMVQTELCSGGTERFSGQYFSVHFLPKETPTHAGCFTSKPLIILTK